jgi:hypothetical protein
MALSSSNSRKGNDLRMLPSFFDSARHHHTLLRRKSARFLQRCNHRRRYGTIETLCLCVAQLAWRAVGVCAVSAIFVAAVFGNSPSCVRVLLLCLFVCFFQSVCVCVFVCVRLYPGKQAMGPTLTSRKKTEIDEF